jgi:KDO2-lipid IV(A) lauroyltransferase
MPKRWKHLTEYAVFWLLQAVVRLLPLPLVHRTGHVLGRLAYPFLTSRRRVALKNLHNAFPDLEEKQREEIARRSFQSVAATFVELLWQKNLKDKEQLRRRLRIENPEIMEYACDRQKGVVFLSAHFGSWELAFQGLSAYVSRPITAIVKPQSNPYVDRLITQWRGMYGAKVVPMGISVRETLRALQQGGIVAMAGDQSAPKESIAVEFFGRDVPTFQGPAVFSLKTGAAIVLGLAVRQPDGDYTMNLKEVPTADLHGATPENIYELTRRQVRMTEDIIRTCPEQWMWMHKRWKHVPDRIEAAA